MWEEAPEQVDAPLPFDTSTSKAGLVLLLLKVVRARAGAEEEWDTTDLCFFPSASVPQRGREAVVEVTSVATLEDEAETAPP